MSNINSQLTILEKAGKIAICFAEASLLDINKPLEISITINDKVTITIVDSKNNQFVLKYYHPSAHHIINAQIPTMYFNIKLYLELLQQNDLI